MHNYIHETMPKSMHNEINTQPNITTQNNNEYIRT